MNNFNYNNFSNEILIHNSELLLSNYTIYGNNNVVKGNNNRVYGMNNILYGENNCNTYSEDYKNDNCQDNCRNDNCQDNDNCKNNGKNLKEKQTIIGKIYANPLKYYTKGVIIGFGTTFLLNGLFSLLGKNVVTIDDAPSFIFLSIFYKSLFYGFMWPTIIPKLCIDPKKYLIVYNS